MLRLVILLACATTQSGCAGLVLYGASQAEARTATSRVMEQKRPDLDPMASADCVVRGMRPSELIFMANNNEAGITGGDVSRVDDALARPKVAACLAALPPRAG